MHTIRYQDTQDITTSIHNIFIIKDNCHFQIPYFSKDV